MIVLLLVTGLNSVQVPSIAGVLPLRTDTVTDVPAGEDAAQLISPQLTGPAPSRILEVNVPDDA